MVLPVHCLSISYGLLHLLQIQHNDSARPDVVEDLRRAGYNAKLANKAVKKGIDAVKSLQLVIDRNSHNLIKLRNYKWKTNGDITLDEPVKLWDDACFIGETLITTKRGLVQLKILNQMKTIY